jgi:hypothetical protein
MQTQTQNIPITEYGLAASGSYSLTGSQPFTMVIRTWQEKAAHGKLLAQELHDILVDLSPHHAETIYPIMSILAPFIEATEELNLDMPPKSSRRVAINITHRGKAKPEFYVE